MALLPIETELTGSNTILRKRSQEVEDILSPDIQQFIRDMHETLAHTDNGVGLAAPQVGKNIRIFIAAPELGLNQTVFINPVITKVLGKEEPMEEGCLSLPGLYGHTVRSNSLRLEAYNERGRKFKMKADGLIAQLVQHEIGHLNGELFKDIAEQVSEIHKK
ncbi:MAG: peptide deformylase [Candidatus Azambacteria bacterium]|nr:peptide deformylase [Candidatus Azambacteria bacterium]